MTGVRSTALLARIGLRALLTAWLLGVAVPVGAAADPGSVDLELESLVQDLPRTRPSGRGVGRVAFLGVYVQPEWTEQAKQHGWIRSIDLPRVHATLDYALGQRFDLVQGVEPLPASQRSSLFAFQEARPVIASANQTLDVDAVAFARVRLLPGLPGGFAVDLRLVGGRTEPGAFVRDASATLPTGLSSHGRWNGLVVLALVASVGLALRPLLRGAGTLEVMLPSQPQRGADERSTDGKFQVANNAVTSIHVKPWAAKSGSAQDKARSDPRLSRSLVGAKTSFEKLAPGDYRVEVRRVFRDPETSEVTCIQSEEKRASVRRGRTVQLRFELSDEELSVDVEVRDGEALVEDGVAVVGLKGRVNSQKYVRGGRAQLDVQRGEHNLLLGYQDRVYLQPVTVESAARRITVTFDVGSLEGLVFSDCEPAVQPFVQGDREGAIELLDREGQTETARLLRAELLRDRGDTSEATAELEAAGRIREAAELAERSDDRSRAATLFEQAGDPAKAATLFRETGDFEGAMRAFASAGSYDDAIACAFQSGSRDAAVRFMEQKGAYFDAAREALDMGDMDLAIRLLQKVSLHDGNYGESCITLTQLFAKKGEPELALQKLDEAVEVFGSDSFLELREQVAELLQEKGLFDKALEACETIRKRDLEYPGVAEKIDELRAKLRNDATKVAQGSVASADPGSTAALEGRYEILGQLGRGAMGIVYQARDRRLGRIVALKRLPDNLKEHPTAVRLFLREARAAAALNHGNIVTLFDADQEDGVYYLTMEYMDGLPLDSVLSKRGRLSVRDTLRIALQVSNGLEYAHSENIIHRDIKPSNLFYTRKKQLKIMDFGLAKMVEEVRKAASVIGGTPYYMAPEQAVGEFCDHRADQYAFGVTIFQLVTGRVPFEEGDVTYHHRHTPPPDPREFAAEVPADMAELILTMMAKTPEDRVETSEAVTRRLSDLLRRAEAEG